MKLREIVKGPASLYRHRYQKQWKQTKYWECGVESMLDNYKKVKEGNEKKQKKLEFKKKYVLMSTCVQSHIFHKNDNRSVYEYLM
jgi:hypothetical protein